MTGIDEVSTKLGALDANYENLSDRLSDIQTESKERHEKIFDKLDGLHTIITSQHTDIQTTKDKVEDLEPKVENHEKMKNRALGIVAGMSAAGGTLAAKITSMFTNT